MTKSEPQLLNELVEGLTQAEGACSQLVHSLQDPRFMMIRQALNISKEGVTSLATIAARKITPIRPH